VRLCLLIIAGWLLLSLAKAAPGETNLPPSATVSASTARRYDLDPRSPLDSRFRQTPASVLKMFADDGTNAPTAHVLTDDERLKLANAFASLPPLHRRVLGERLRTVSFLDGMPNTALTSTVNPGEPYKLFDITIRAAILHQNISQWLTEKERTCFDMTGSPLSVSIEAGKRDAILYVLLHEGAHIVDSSLGLTPPMSSDLKPGGIQPATSFTVGVWSESSVPLPLYRDSLREQARFHAGGKVLPVDQAESIYASLRRTPFVSLYGSRNWYEDLAEYVAVFHLTEKLGEPFRVVVRNQEKEIFAWEPMKSDLVRARAGQMRQFYSDSR
jgi:hypothetical protein